MNKIGDIKIDKAVIRDILMNNLERNIKNFCSIFLYICVKYKLNVWNETDEMEDIIKLNVKF